MREKKDWIKSLESLCHIYEDYTKKNSDSRLKIVIENNLIGMYLYNSGKLVDKFILGFVHKEIDMYNYISMAIMKIFFSGSVVYSRDNVFYNDKNTPNIEMIVCEDDMLNKMFSMVSIYKDIDFYDKIDCHRKVRNRINRYRDARYIEDKIELSKNLLDIRR